MEKEEFIKIFGNLSDDVVISISMGELRKKLLGRGDEQNFLDLEIKNYILERMPNLPRYDQCRIRRFLNLMNSHMVERFKDLLDKDGFIRSDIYTWPGMGDVTLKYIKDLYQENGITIKGM